MTKYTPFELKDTHYSVCAKCDEDKELTKALDTQESRKVANIKGYIRKQISHGLCDPHFEEAMQEARQWKADKNSGFIRPRGVDLEQVEAPELLTQEQFDKIVDETAAKFNNYKPKNEFNIEEWMRTPIRPGQAILNLIDPRT